MHVGHGGPVGLLDLDFFIGVDALATEYFDTVLLELNEEFNRVIQLIESSLDAAFRGHGADDCLGLVGANAKHTAHVLKGNVQVDLRKHLDVVLEGCLEQDRIAVLINGLLVFLQFLLLEWLQIFPLDDVV